MRADIADYKCRKMVAENKNIVKEKGKGINLSAWHCMARAVKVQYEANKILIARKAIMSF